MVLGKKVAIFDWEWGRNSAPGDGQKFPCMQQVFVRFVHLHMQQCTHLYPWIPIQMHKPYNGWTKGIVTL